MKNLFLLIQLCLLFTYIKAEKTELNISSLNPKKLKQTQIIRSNNDLTKIIVGNKFIYAIKLDSNLNIVQKKKFKKPSGLKNLIGGLYNGDKDILVYSKKNIIKYVIIDYSKSEVVATKILAIKNKLKKERKVTNFIMNNKAYFAYINYKKEKVNFYELDNKENLNILPFNAGNLYESIASDKDDFFKSKKSMIKNLPKFRFINNNSLIVSATKNKVYIDSNKVFFIIKDRTSVNVFEYDLLNKTSQNKVFTPDNYKSVIDDVDDIYARSSNAIFSTLFDGKYLYINSLNQNYLISRYNYNTEEKEFLFDLYKNKEFINKQDTFVYCKQYSLECKPIKQKRYFRNIKRITPAISIINTTSNRTDFKIGAIENYTVGGSGMMIGPSFPVDKTGLSLYFGVGFGSSRYANNKTEYECNKCFFKSSIDNKTGEFIKLDQSEIKETIIDKIHRIKKLGFKFVDFFTFNNKPVISYYNNKEKHFYIDFAKKGN